MKGFGLDLRVNSLNPKTDQNLISPHSKTAESLIIVLRIKTNDRQP